MSKSEDKHADFSDVTGGTSSTVPNARTQAEQTYTVQEGDTLWKISQRLLGDGAKWKEIHEANKDSIKNPDLIYPGQVIRIPKN